MILDLQAQSLRALGRCDYDRAKLESVIVAGTLPPAVTRGGRYRVAVEGKRIVASGGWLDSCLGTRCRPRATPRATDIRRPPP